MGCNLCVACLPPSPRHHAHVAGYSDRGIIGTNSEDVHVLEQKAPFWLLEFLLGNRVPAKEPVKIVSCHARHQGGFGS